MRVSDLFLRHSCAGRASVVSFCFSSINLPEIGRFLVVSLHQAVGKLSDAGVNSVAPNLSMAFSSASPSSSPVIDPNSRKYFGLLENMKKRKHNFIQLFAMTGILLLSIRSLRQKYRIHDLQEDTYALKEEQESISKRMKNIKHALLHEASFDSTGLFASRLRLLFGEDE